MGDRSNTTKVFVGSIPAGTTVNELRNLFAPYGPIAECDVVNRCGFVHLENKQLAFKAIDELNNFNFKGNRITVEKGRVKQQSGPSRNGGGRNQYQRNSFGNGYGGGGPMRGNREYFRGAPYERRGNMPMPMPRRDNYGYGYDSRPPLRNMMMGPGPGPGPAPGPDRRPYMDERNNRYTNEFGDAAPYNRRTLDERNNSHLMMDRRPLMDAQVPPMNGGSYTYRQPQVDMYNRRDIPPESMGGYNSIPHDSSYGSGYPPLQQPQRGFVGGPGPGLGPRRDTSLPRRY